MRARLRRIGDGLAALAGARTELLEAAPGVRSRFVALGGTLLSTGGLAVLSAAFAVHMALGVWWPFALVFGLFWGVVIVNLDRMLVVGMAHDASVKRNVLMAVPRVALALVLGTVIATPLTLQVFHREIDTEIVTLQAEQSDAYKAKLNSDARFRQLPALAKRVSTEQAIVASGGQSDPAVESLQAGVTTAQADYDAALKTYQSLDAKAQCELNGTCGTGQPGTGTAYVQAKAAADAQAAVVANAKHALDTATSAASAAQSRSAVEAASNLSSDKTTLARLTAEQDRLQAAFDATNKDDNGILIRLQALSRLSDENAMLSAAHTMLSLLFICIELLPVLTKVLLNFGPPTAYDRLAALRDRTDVAVEEIEQQARETVEQAKNEILVMAELERLERQKEAIQERQRLAEERLARARAEREEAARLEAIRQAAAAAARPAEVEDPVDDGRKPWDTGPILSAARNGLYKTLRTVTGRTGEREPASA
jgi:hypothetical protein